METIIENLAKFSRRYGFTQVLMRGSHEMNVTLGGLLCPDRVELSCLQYPKVSLQGQSSFLLLAALSVRERSIVVNLQVAHPGGARKSEKEGAPFPNLALYPYCSVMSSDDLFRQRQS
jgi:hypothetical protein